MLTFTSRRNRAGDLCNNSATATLTLFDNLMNINEKRVISARDWDFLDRQYTLTTIADTFTVTIASPGVFTLTAHSFTVGSVVYFSTTGALPTGLTAGTAYYVVSAGLTADAFEVSTTINGTAVNTSGTQSGTHTVTTQRYVLPPYTAKPKNVYVTVGSYRYSPKEVSTQKEWDYLNEVVTTGDAVTHYRIYDGYLELYPKPSTADSVVTINARRVARDLSFADYTTGNIDIVTNGSQLVTGAGTPAWTVPMAGRWLKITPSNTATADGDGYWYEIARVISSTTLVLRKPYGGTSLTTGAAGAYIIGEASLIPEPHDMLPVYDALQTYFTSVDPNQTKASLYKQLYREGYEQMVRDQSSKADVVLDNGEKMELINPNLTVTL
ncbi:MAG: hypothetical protein AAB706_00830 [Patescibacteria group bacterium]